MPLSLLLAQVDTGSPGYVVAAVLAVAALVLLYLAIVAVRVHDAARRLDALERQLAEGSSAAADDPAPPPDPSRIPS